MDMKKIIPFCLLAFVAFACSKGKFETKPRLEIKSVSSDIVPLRSGLEVVLEFFDKEGDVDSAITIIRNRINRRRAAQTLRDSINYRIPEFPNKSNGEIILSFSYEQLKSANPAPSLGGGLYESDSLLYKFILKDRAKNISDTVSKLIVILRDNR